MSIEFALKRLTLRPLDVSGLLIAWARECSIEGNCDGEGSGSATFFQPGRSIRGFSVRNDRRILLNSMELRLSVCASEADWTSAYAFMTFLLARGVSVRSLDEERLAPGDLTPAAARRRWREQFGADVAFLQHMLHSAGEEFVQLPVRAASVPVTRADVPGGRLEDEVLLAVQARLQERAVRIGEARPASLVTLADETTLVVWSGEPLIAPAADYVVLGSQDDADVARSVVVPWAAVVRANLLEPIAQKPARFYFAAIDRHSTVWQELLAQGRPIDELRSPGDHR